MLVKIRKLWCICYVFLLFYSNIASQLEETGPLNSSWYHYVNPVPFIPTLRLAINISIAKKMLHFLVWIFASKTWCLVTVTNLQ